MIVRILFFASVRERIGKSDLRLELPDGSTVSHLQERLSHDHPSLSNLLPVCRFSINSEYAELDQRLPNEAEIGIIPPVSGGAGETGPGEVLHAAIVRDPIDLKALTSKVYSPECGASLNFAGMVRADKEAGRDVQQIIYEGYEKMAEIALREIAQAAARKHQARVAVEHRLGCLKIGEISVGIAVATAHRADGFGALKDIIETIKKDLPIWKKEEFSDGSAQWVRAGKPQD